MDAIDVFYSHAQIGDNISLAKLLVRLLFVRRHIIIYKMIIYCAANNTQHC